jgi:hypothetical protein
MDHYAGIDVSLECSSVCVVDASGKIVREAKVASEPEARRFATVHESDRGTFETCRPTPTMSVYWGRPEVVAARSERRD